MPQRHTISGRRSALIWLSIVIGLVLVIALVVIVLFVYPEYQHQQQVEQHYQAGVAFQDAEDWDRAVEIFEKCICRADSRQPDSCTMDPDSARKGLKPLGGRKKSARLSHVRVMLTVHQLPDIYKFRPRLVQA
ncbi:MAG TPA: hypothetical protein EYP04_06490, partial [Anaerolineae bacterium]|nr:hypothetical protein [Anaerolineae bacterium]